MESESAPKDMSDVYLHQSLIAGIGVFAARRFTAGDWILSFLDGAPTVVPYSVTTHIPEEEGNYIQIGPDKYILPAPPSLYLNHSCDPNVGVRDATEIVALIDIEADTELIFDYSTSMAEDGWELDCACSASRCRGRIRDFKYIPVERQLFYLERNVVGSFCVDSITLSAK